jgi:hypothetical protein
MIHFSHLFTVVLRMFLSVDPVWYIPQQSPEWLMSSFGEEKRCISPISASMMSDESSAIPGMLVSIVVFFIFCVIFLILFIASFFSCFRQWYTCTRFLMSGSSSASTDNVSSVESLLYFTPFRRRYPRIFPWICVLRRVRVDLCRVRSRNFSVCSSGIHTDGVSWFGGDLEGFWHQLCRFFSCMRCHVFSSGLQVLLRIPFLSIFYVFLSTSRMFLLRLLYRDLGCLKGNVQQPFLKMERCVLW